MKTKSSKFAPEHEVSVSHQNADLSIEIASIRRTAIPRCRSTSAPWCVLSESVPPLCGKTFAIFGQRPSFRWFWKKIQFCMHSLRLPSSENLQFFPFTRAEVGAPNSRPFWTCYALLYVIHGQCVWSQVRAACIRTILITTYFFFALSKEHSKLQKPSGQILVETKRT